MNTTINSTGKENTASRTRLALSLAALALTMGTSLAAVAGPYDYDPGVGLTSDNQCNVGANTRLISTSDVTSEGNNADTCFGAYDGNNNFGPLLWDGNTWDQIAKLDVDEDGGLSQSGNQITLDFGSGGMNSGEWIFSGDTSQWDSFFVVTKAANNPGWAAYFFDEIFANGDLTGTFSIPWSAGNSSDPADLSHLSLYANSTFRVPEPATLGLLGLSLLALGLRRKQ